MARRSSSRRSSARRPFRAFLWINLAVALLIGGCGRTDFPQGDASALYDSISQRLFSLPDATRVFLCHDYLPAGRSQYQYMTTLGEQRAHNVHVHQGVAEAQFVSLRQARDATLGMPTLLLPSVQVNMRAGCLPPAEDNGVRYLKIPLDAL